MVRVYRRRVRGYEGSAPWWPVWVALGMVLLGFVPVVGLLNFLLLWPMLLLLAVLLLLTGTESAAPLAWALLLVLLAQAVSAGVFVWGLFHLG